MGARPFIAAVGLAAAVAAAAGCGGGGSAGGANGSLVAKIADAKASIEGASLVATAQVTEGGKAGEHVEVRWHLVDAVTGVRASESDRVGARYLTTASVETKTVSIRVPVPGVSTDYLVHFELDGRDGSYLASEDSPIVTVE